MLTLAIALVAVSLFVFATDESMALKGAAAGLFVSSLALRFVFEVHFLIPLLINVFLGITLAIYFKVKGFTGW